MALTRTRCVCLGWSEACRYTRLADFLAGVPATWGLMYLGGERPLQGCCGEFNSHSLHRASLSFSATSVTAARRAFNPQDRVRFPGSLILESWGLFDLSHSCVSST